MTDEAQVRRFPAQEEQRLDKFLVERLPDLSRSRIQNLIREGLVKVDGKPASKTGQTVEPPSVIEVYLPPNAPSTLIPEDLPLEVIFENKDLLVINKAAGMVVHPAAGHGSGTLVNAALAYAPDMEGIGGEQRPGVVHRLDKDTSGLILLAKNDLTHRWLVKQFSDRKVEKIYLALVDGKPPTPTGRVEAPIGRSPIHRQNMAVVPAAKGRESVTEYRTLESFPKHTLLEVHPITGRTHQIRVHMAFLDCPIAGDTVYGRKHSTIPLNRQFLHAARITIHLPGETEARRFEAPMPEDLAAVLSTLKI